MLLSTTPATGRSIVAIDLIKPVRSVTARLMRSHFVRHVAIVTGGTALAQVITIALSPILTRLYSPSDFGILSIYVSVLGIAVVAAGLRYEMAIPLPESADDAANLLALGLGSVVICSALAALISLGLGPRLLRHGRYSGLIPLLWLLPISMFGAGAYQVLSFWGLRKRGFTALARTKIVQSGGQALTQLALGALRSGPLGLVLGDVVGRVGCTASLGTWTWREDGQALRSASWDGMRRMAVRFRRFPILSSGSALLNEATLQTPLLIIAAFYGPTIAGLFAVGQRLLAAPMSLVGKSIASVYYSTLATIARNEPQAVQGVFVSLTKRLTLMGLGPLLLAAVLGPWLCEKLLGAQWREAGVFLRIMAPALLLQFAGSPLGGTLDVLERQDLHLVREIVRQLLCIGALVCAKLYHLVPVHAVALFSAAATVGYLFYIGSTWYALRDLRGRPSLPAASSWPDTVSPSP